MPNRRLDAGGRALQVNLEAQEPLAQTGVMSSSESEESLDPRERLHNARTHIEQVTEAIMHLGNKRGSSRDEIADYLVSENMMEPRIAKALVAKALYRGVEQKIFMRPKGSSRYQVRVDNHGRNQRQARPKVAAKPRKKVVHRGDGRSRSHRGSRKY